MRYLRTTARGAAASLVLCVSAFGAASALLSALTSGCATSEADTSGGATDEGGSGNVDAGGTPVGADSGGGTKDASADGAMPFGGDAGALPDGATWKSSLRVCWNDPSCTRALAISHGGDWQLNGPAYDSNAALAAAVTSGADGVKIDVRFTKDNVGVISHSSPIQLYESVDCNGKKIEEMTVAEVTSCHRVPGNENFQKLDDVLDALRGQLAIQLCVKVNTEFGKTIQAVLAKNAQDFAFIEANSGDFPAIVPLPSYAQLYYVVNVGTTVADIDTVIGFKNPRIIMLEIDPSIALNGMAASKIHPAGMHAFTYDNSDTATQSDLKALFDQGYDVVSSNVTGPDVAARIQVNTSRGVSPP